MAFVAMRLASGALLVRVLLLLLLSASQVEGTWQYGIMVDAGSGGSRLHVFRWPPRQADPMRPLYAAVTKPEELTSFAVRPGISSFAHNVSGLDDYINSLLKKAEDGLQSLRESWYLIPIYFKATAGARDLYRDQRDAIFAKIRSILFASQFRFDSEYWARTVSGEEEAVHGWLTVNAIKGTYRADQAGNTWGALDMGGASTQMAYIPKDVSIVQNYFPLHISYYHIHLYSHSFLEFGYRDAHIRLIRRLKDVQNASATKDDPIANPCAPTGSLYALPLADPFAETGDQVWWVSGSGNFSECTAMTQFLLHKDARCYVPATSRKFATVTTQKRGACGMNGIYEPQLNGRNFVAIGQYAKLADLIGVPLNEPVALGSLLPGMMKICAEASPTTLIEDIDDPDGTLHQGGVHWKDPMSLPFARCWKVVWMFSVLHDGLRFPLDTKQITFAKSLNGQETGWALGAMMHEVNYFPWRSAVTSGELSAQPFSVGEEIQNRWGSMGGAWIFATAGALAAAVGFGVAIGWRAARSGRWRDDWLHRCNARLLA